MEAVQFIEVKNVLGSGIVFSFTVSDGENNTTSTDSYAVSKSRTIDLAGSTFPVNDEVWPVINVWLFGLPGATKAADQHFKFALNGKTAVYEGWGTAWEPKIQFLKIIDAGNHQRPPGFPGDIPVNAVPYTSWNGTITAKHIWTCAPRNAADVVDACNWAAKNNFTVRPRGIMHTWSPLTIADGLPDLPNILLIDTTKFLHNMEMLTGNEGYGKGVRVETGATMGHLMQFLEQQPNSSGAAGGFSFPHIPAPGHLTVGGVLAINGHGSAVRTTTRDDFPSSYGSMSNHILEFKAVVTDPESATPDVYTLKTFRRGDPYTKAFLTQLGRTIIVEATLQVIDNYNLRCLSYTDLDKSILFCQPSGPTPPSQSCGDFLNQFGRIEIIWFPFTDKPWLKVWSVEPVMPKTSRLVNSPDNYVFSDNLPEQITALLQKITDIPGTAVPLGEAMGILTSNALDGKGFFGNDGVYQKTRDIWGPSRNTLIYVKDSTLRITANGYAILMNKADVQQGIADFAEKFDAMLSKYRGNNQYPINSPLEIRVTDLDRHEYLPGSQGQDNFDRPVLSSVSADAETEKNQWNVALWLDVLTLPGTPYANAFYAELEEWFLDHFKAPKARVVPEWSKGWGYNNQNGPWKNSQFFDHIRKVFTENRSLDDNWDWAKSAFTTFDKHNLFHNPLLDQLFINQS